MATDSQIAHENAQDRGTLRMRTFRDGNAQVIKLAGELDLAAADRLERELRRAERSDADVIAVDLRELTFIESTGMRLILAAQERSSRGSERLVLVRGTGAVRRLFEICGVADALPFVDQLPSDDAGSASPDAARRAISRRVSQAALAGAILELSTHRRPGVSR